MDDGPSATADALALLRALLEDGSTTAVCTPHVRDVVIGEIPERVAALATAARAAGVDIELVASGELAAEDVGDLSDRDLGVLSLGPSDAPWVLLECPLGGGDRSPLARAADELRARGRDVVLAHPERSPGLFADGGAALSRELDHGAVLQVNAPSLLGRHGPEARTRAIELITSEAIPIVLASDAHSAVRRPPLLRAARRWLLDHELPEGRFASLTMTGASRLLAAGTPGVYRRDASGRPA